MNLALTDDQKLLQKTVRKFAESEVKPLAKEVDETGISRTKPSGRLRNLG
jgi:alkylation response protein AidB-like acyl-CoA dehydrogenase